MDQHAIQSPHGSAPQASAGDNTLHSHGPRRGPAPASSTFIIPVIITTPAESILPTRASPTETEIDMEAASIHSNQSYRTAHDYEDALFENNFNDTDHGLDGQGHDSHSGNIYTDCYKQSDLQRQQSRGAAPVRASEDPSVDRPDSLNQRHFQEQQEGSAWHQTDHIAYGHHITSALLQQQMTILHPALSSFPVPSSVAPTIYALASSVPHPTVNQLSMNLSCRPAAAEQVAVPFKTILCTPPTTASTNQSLTEDASIPAQQSCPPTKRCICENVLDDSHALPDTGSDRTVGGRGDDDIHLYSNSTSLPERPMSSLSTHPTSKYPVPPEAGANEWSKLSAGPGSPTQTTSFFTPSSNSTKIPEHHAMRDEHLDQSQVKKKADERQKVEEEEAAAAVDGNNSIGSRTTVFGFAPMYNKGDQRANMQSSEERVLRDGHVCRTFPLDRRTRPSLGANSVDESGGEPSSSRTNYGSTDDRSGCDLHPMAIPHARAGISPTLNLDQFEIKAPHQEVEESVESLIESKDWSKTGLGPRSSWPMELSILVPLLMKSASPLAIYWGDQNYLIYNDAWRPILKQKHPLALGAPGATVWSEVWDILGSQISRVRKEGRGTDNKGFRLDLNRAGFEEECYFDCTLTPIFMQDGSIGGLWALDQEVTQSVMNQRRVTTLNQFSKQVPLIQSVNGAYSMITSILQESNNLDIPFSIVYRTEEVDKESNTPTSRLAYAPQASPILNDQPPTQPDNETFHATESYTDTKDTRRRPQTAILCSTSFDRNLDIVNYGDCKENIFSKAISTRHIPDSLLITPEEYEPLDPSDPVYDDPWEWPVRSVLADGIPRLVTLPKSTHKLARALLLPILESTSASDPRITTVLIVGINPFLILDNQYLDFLALLVTNIASLLRFGRSREEERKSTEALYELNKSKISFFQNVSHELRTPLTLMLSPLDDVLNRTPENSPNHTSLEMVRRNSRRLLKLVNTLLQFSRIEAGKSHAIFEETDLTKVTREISANFESVARGFGLDYIINCEDLDDVPGGIWIDRAMWGGVILNLLGNAFKHTWEGSITVHQYPSKEKNGCDGVAVDVKDTGVGIAPEHLHTLFGRFNRIENKQSRSHEGTGIGLSLVKELTEVHGGTVSVSSEVDKGTCFHLWIPAGKNHHPSAQVKLGDSKELGSSSLLRPPKSEAMNNKTDASMFVEEASQWIAHKALPGSTLTASGTDSTEEEKLEDDDDTIHLSIDYMHDRQDPVDINTDFEVSTTDLDESELTKLLIDAPESEDMILPENAAANIAAAQIPPRRTSSSAHSLKVSVAETPILPFKGYSTPALPQAESAIDTSVNDDGGYGGVDNAGDLVKVSEDNNTLPVRSRRGYIIIVDDNNDMRSYLREILGKDFRVRCAVDGLDAIRLISERLQQGKRIDLILSDVAMPNMNGYELLKRLRSNSATMTTPFILLSARAGEEANVEGLNLGADDCLVKPFSARELLARVRSTIRLSDLRHELIREQRHALEMKQLIYSISVRIRSGLSLPQILDTASRELFKVIRCNAIRICRFRRVDPETGQHWVRFVSEIVKVGKPKILTTTDRLLPQGLEIMDSGITISDQDSSSELRHVTNYQHLTFGPKSFISVALIYNRKVWGYLLASRDADQVDWSQSERMLFEQTGNQISMAIAHASLWELKKSQQVEMEAAHAANEAKSQILANTSHELRTPIGAIVGALSALEDTDYNLTGEQRDMIKIMQITSDVALSVINDLLDTAKLEAGAMSLSFKECPGLVETLEHSVRIFADKAGRKEIDLIMEPSEDLENLDIQIQQGSIVWTDGDRLQQVIMNLIGNAVKFTAVGKVVISCSLVTSGIPLLFPESTTTDDEQREDGQAQQESRPRVHQTLNIPPDAKVSHATFRFEVSDTGIGINPDFLKNHIFKSFAQYDQSMTRRFGGTGLGLAISKHLVMMNGGVLGVTSNVGKGSTFYFTWPISIIEPPSIQRIISTPPTLAPEIAFETRAVVIEPLEESRHHLARNLSRQNIQVTLYENCDSVVQDEKVRQSDLLGPDGTVLTENYRPNAHFFFATRMSTAEVTVETARALGELFKKRNDDAKAQGIENYKDLILSVVLVIFSSPQGRYLAKDMVKRICSNGLEHTVQCRYIVKPVKPDRIIECLTMLGSHEPFTRGHIGESHDIVEIGLIQRQHHQQLHQKRSRRSLPNGHGDRGMDHTESQVIRTDGRISLISSDYEWDNNCNKNTVESSSLGPEGRFDSPDHKKSLATVNGDLFMSPTPASEPNVGPTQIKPAAATQRRLRTTSRATPLAKAAPSTRSTDDSSKSSSENPPPFSNRAARAAGGKRERRGKCILCVEDNIINLRVVQYQLQKLGYDTQSACDGQVAVDIIKAQVDVLGQDVASCMNSEDGEVIETGATSISTTRAALVSPSATVATSGASRVSSSASNKHSKIDLILMDCAMPVKSGFDAASEIRAMGLSSVFAAKIPIIALTASAIPSTKEKCIASGMNGYLSKPTKLTDLEAMLNQWIE